MKIKPKQYAAALFEAVKGLPNDKAKLILANFVKILVKNNALRMSPQILENFEKYASREEGIAEIKITTAQPIKEDLTEFLRKEASNLLGKKIKQANIKKEIKSDLLGGFVIECEDIIFDASVKNKLKILRNNLINK